MNRGVMDPSSASIMVLMCFGLLGPITSGRRSYVRSWARPDAPAMTLLSFGTWLREALINLPSPLGSLAQAVSLSGVWPGGGAQGLLPLSCRELEQRGRAAAERSGLEPGLVGDWCWVLGAVATGFSPLVQTMHANILMIKCRVKL